MMFVQAPAQVPALALVELVLALVFVLILIRILAPVKYLLVLVLGNALEDHCCLYLRFFNIARQHQRERHDHQHHPK